MNSPFLVPTVTTVSPFFASAMSTTRHGGQDPHRVPDLQPDVLRREVGHGVLVHEDEDEPPHPPLVVELPVREAVVLRVDLADCVRDGSPPCLGYAIPARVTSRTP